MHPFPLFDSYPSLAHTDADVDQTIQAFETVIPNLQTYPSSPGCPRGCGDPSLLPV